MTLYMSPSRNPFGVGDVSISLSLRCRVPPVSVNGSSASFDLALGDPGVVLNRQKLGASVFRGNSSVPL